MNDFLQDLWYDLRARRLWPIAAALLVALVAVPLLLIKPADAPAPAATQSASPADKGIPKVSLTPAVETSSNLDVFTGKDPFRTPGSARKAAKAVVSAAPVPVAPTAKSPSGGGGGSTGTPDPSPGGTGGGLGGGSPTPAVPKTVAPRVVTPKSKAYTYVLDVTFGASGRTRRIRTMRRFRMLPSSRSPFLVFLGVDATGKRAVFLVDGRLKQTGEGVCRPSPSQCSFLYLKVDEDRNEHFFTREDGTEYSLELNAIRKAAVKKASTSSRKAARGASAGKPRAHASTGRKAPFEAPMLVDLGIGG